MALGLKFHLRTHRYSSIPLVRIQRAPLFQVQSIQTSSFSPLKLKSRTINPNRFNALYLEKWNSNDGGGGGGGGGGVAVTRKERGDGGGGGGGSGVRKVVRLFLRFAEFIMEPEQVIVGALGLPARLAWLCAQAMWELHIAMEEIGNGIVQFGFVGFLLVSAVITFLFVHFF